MLVDRARQIVTPQGLFGPLHRAFRLFQGLTGRRPALCSRTGQLPALAFDLVPQGLLAICQRSLPLLSPLTAICLTFALALSVALALVALTAPLPAIPAFVLT